MPDPPGVFGVPPDGVFVVAGGVVVPGGVALVVGEDVFGVLPGDEVAGPDPGPVDVLVLTGVPPEGVLAGVLLVPGSVCVELPPLHELPMQTGALPFTGALPATEGASPTAPTWTVPTDCVTVCEPESPDVVVLSGPVELCVEAPPLQLLATHTGTLPFTGASRDAAGLTPTAPIWPVTIESATFCGPPPPLVLVLLFGPVELCVESPPLQLLAMHTGALAFTGALSEAAGSTAAEPTCADPIDWSTSCGPEPPLECVELLEAAGP
jgi:hypothetical protein